jgi:hypothetical protein
MFLHHDNAFAIFGEATLGQETDTSVGAYIVLTLFGPM